MGYVCLIQARIGRFFAAFARRPRHSRESGNPESPNNVILAKAGTG